MATVGASTRVGGGSGSLASHGAAAAAAVVVGCSGGPSPHWLGQAAEENTTPVGIDVRRVDAAGHLRALDGLAAAPRLHGGRRGCPHRAIELHSRSIYRHKNPFTSCGCVGAYRQVRQRACAHRIRWWGWGAECVRLPRRAPPRNSVQRVVLALPQPDSFADPMTRSRQAGPRHAVACSWVAGIWSLSLSRTHREERRPL